MTKRDLGIAAIATIGFLSQRMGDRFGGMLLLPDRVKRLPARSGRTALYGMLRQMLTEPIVPDNASGDLELADGIEQLARSQRRRGMRVVVSDFLMPVRLNSTLTGRLPGNGPSVGWRCETRCSA